MSTDDNRTPHLPADYDRQIRGVIPYYRELHTEILNLVRSYRPHPDAWLDTGCGTGSLICLASSMFPETRFILADPSASMMEQARSKLQGCDRIRYLQPAQTQELQGVDMNSLDVITAIQCHHYQAPSERRRAVAECHGLLREHGIFLTTENIRPFTAEGTAIGKNYWGQYQKDYGRNEDEIKIHLSRFDKEYFPITVMEHLDILKEAGFRTVEMFWYSYMQAGFYAIK
jgi:tRNA (cmo5U34)-methyltransferase